MKQIKSMEKRLSEIIELRKKLEELGFDAKNEQVKYLYDKMNSFVKDAEGFSDKIDLPDYNRIALCKFSLQPHCVSTIVLRTNTTG
jgi:hypothetical protein